MIFRVCLKCDICIAVGAFKVESKDLDSQVDLIVANLHSHVEFGPNIKVIRTGVTSQTHRQHVPHNHKLLFPSPSFNNSLMIEVLRDILV